MISINDPSDPRVAPFRDIKERDLVGRQGMFIAEGEVVLRVLLRSALCRPVAVLIAAPLVDKIPLFWLRILVLIVVLYTAIRMLTSAAQEKAAAQQTA